jgi:predicted flap endonuclease-1-like 5' DNA nuclease
MTNFWCNFLPVIIGIGSAILGGLIGWFMRRPRIEELSEVIETQEANYLRLKNAHDTLGIRNNSLQDSYNSVFSDHQRLEQDYATLESKNAYLQLQFNNYKYDVESNKVNTESYHAELESYKNETASKIADLHDQLAEWQQEYNTLYTKYDISNKRLAELESSRPAFNIEENTQLSGQYSALLKEMDEYKSERDTQISELNEQIENWRNSYEQLLETHDNSKIQIKNIEDDLEEWRGHYETLLAANESLNNRISTLELERTENKSVVVEKQDTTSDELQNIQARYDELEVRLSGMSRRYQEITSDKEKLEQIVKSLNAELTTYRNRYIPDDLKIIEGIGPKIEELLNNAGIIKYSQLSETDPAQIKSLLDAAGSRFAMHNPETWSIQAELAKKGEWDKLKEYQDYLNAGRDTKAKAES